MRYNHMFSIAFSLTSEHQEGDDVTPEMLQEAILLRVDDLMQHDPKTLVEAVGMPEDTYEIEDIHHAGNPE